MNHSFKNFILISLILLFWGCNETRPIDLIVHNAQIYTVNPLFEVAQAMAIDKGKIVAVGAENEILNKYYSENKIDAKKQAIFPGFIDAHCHFVGYAQNLTQVNLVGTQSFNEVLDRVKAFANRIDNEWIIGRGWDQNDWSAKDFPTNKELNTLFPNRPVFLERIDGHAALVNQAALDLAQITIQTQIDGGIIMAAPPLLQQDINPETGHYSSSLLSGILIDNAVDLVSKVIPKMSNKNLEKALLVAQKKLLEVGLTTIDDAGLSKENIDLIDHLQQENLIQLKIYAMVSSTPELLHYYLKTGPLPYSPLH